MTREKRIDYGKIGHTRIWPERVEESVTKEKMGGITKEGRIEYDKIGHKGSMARANRRECDKIGQEGV